MKKKINFLNETGYCYIPGNEDHRLHYFQCLDSEGTVLHEESYFPSMEKAIEAAKREYPDKDCKIVDLTEKWYLELAEQYRSRIKRLQPNFKKTHIILDISEMYYSRSTTDWYTFIPFEYNGNYWNYRENAMNEWLEKTNLKRNLDKTPVRITSTKNNTIEKGQQPTKPRRRGKCR